jgi:protein-S-isoprenylcysteine O-methyltransferase Ste14
MTELQVHTWLVLLTFVLAAPTFVILLWVNAPYGRFARSGWGPTMSTRLGWIVMESPAVLVFAAVYLAGDHALSTVSLVFLGMWQFHYIIRTFVFPFRIRETGKQIPLLIVAMAILFNCLNAYINARWISHLGDYVVSWLVSAPFILGVLCFATGWLINQHADLVLFRLRKKGETDYKIPCGGLYRWVSCPNYLGEMLQWLGWAIATWSPAGVAFAVFTVANLLPRAIATQRWYRSEFADYPSSRRALIPFVL